MDFSALLAATATGTNAATSPFGKYGMFILIGGVFVLMYFMTIRPQKKKQKEEQALRDNIQVGDEITTIGGICGRVLTVKEDSVIIETGADRNKMKITRWAIQTNNTANEKLEAERAAAKEAAEKAKENGEAPARRRFGKKSAEKSDLEPKE